MDERRNHARETNFSMVDELARKMLDGSNSARVELAEGGMSNRPICAHCGKRYGQRMVNSHTTHWPIGQEMPRFWDGESWFGGYSPFCTLRCALDYARKAYKMFGRRVA